MRALAAIPARMGSRRLPGKPLVTLRGKPLVQHVWEAAILIPSVDQVVIATDSVEVVDAVRGFGGQAALTRNDHATGTDRIAELVEQLDQSYDVVINLQGDEPLLSPAAVEEAMQALASDPDADLSTLACLDPDRKSFENRNVTKVVVDSRGYALYFSRAPVGAPVESGREPYRFLRHVGVYVYRVEALRRFVNWQPSRLELAEQLEQLRGLEHGLKIRVVVTPYQSLAVDTPQDLETLERDWDQILKIRSDRRKPNNLGGFTR